MKYRKLVLDVLVVLVAAILPAAGVTPAAAQHLSGPGLARGDGQALVQISWHDPEGLSRIESTGVPVYTRLTGEGGSYLLAGATTADIDRLEAEGFSVTILDPDMQGATYYLAYPAPNRPQPDWSSYGNLLLDDGVQTLLRTSPQEAEQLAEVGVELRAVTLDPKPLRPALVEGAIPAVVDPDPLIQAMIDQVNTEVVYNYTGNISGEWPVQVGGAPYTITTRNTYSGEPIQKATQYVGEHLAALGMEVEYHVWGGAGYPNVIAELPGLVNPDEIWIICAHLDDMPSGSLAPGADDNGSGSIAVLLAADILTQFQWGSTLRFALWTGEEQGLLGSHYYAQRAYNNGENIAGVLNLDMIAWNTGGSSPTIDLHADSSIPPTLDLAQLMADVVDAYNLNLIPQIVPNGTGASDHASFWDYGYTAILGIEDGSDFNPYYHTTQDDMDNLQDWPYYTTFVKAALATFAHMSGSLIPAGIGYLDGHVTEATGGGPIQGATITVEDPEGHTFTTTTDASGYYSRTLLANTYTVTASAYAYLPQTVAGVEVFEDTVTTLDFELSLAPTYTVQGQVTEFETGVPLDAQIEFLGTPVVVWTDANGYYAATLPQDEYTMRVSAALHQPEERDIVLDHDQIQDFALEQLPCILLVDDDGDGPDVRAYYTAALDELGLDYAVWDVLAQGNPAAGDLLGYNMVLWFTGYPWGQTFTDENEAAVAAYLDDGGNFFLSSQDYLYDFGLTPFGADYLHIASYSSDVGQTTVTGQNVFGGLGPYGLSYPFYNYSDVVNPDAQAQVAFVGNYGNAAISFDGGSFKTAFLGFPLEAVPNLADRAAIVATLVEWFGGCEPPQDVMHVGNIRMFAFPGASRSWVFGFVPIRDQDGNPVQGAAVSGEWTLPSGYQYAQTRVTSSAGWTRFGAVTPQTGVFEVCVTDVSKAGWTYDPNQNIETCETVIVP